MSTGPRLTRKAVPMRSPQRQMAVETVKGKPAERRTARPADASHCLMLVVAERLGRQRFQVQPYGGDFIVRHVGEVLHWHEGVDLIAAGLDPGSHRGSEVRFRPTDQFATRGQVGCRDRPRRGAGDGPTGKRGAMATCACGGQVGAVFSRWTGLRSASAEVRCGRSARPASAPAALAGRERALCGPMFGSGCSASTGGTERM